jgi:DNA-binding MarR family transcriptional regulator
MAVKDAGTEPLLAASRVITAAVVRSLNETRPELSVSQLRILALVSTRPGLSVSDVAAALDVNASNASRACDRLVGMDLLERGVSATDRRQVELQLTTAGSRLVGDVLDRRRAMLAEVVGAMAPAARAAFLDSLAEFNAAAAKVALIRPEESGDEHLMAWLR